MRRLNLHASALNDAEYDMYTTSLDDLAGAHTDTGNDANRSCDDAYYDQLSVAASEKLELGSGVDILMSLLLISIR